MPKFKAYIDTSVFGALYDTEDAKRVRITKTMIEILRMRIGCLPFISNIVIEEIEGAPDKIAKGLNKVLKQVNATILHESEECATLVKEYLKKNIIPRRYRDDCRHIAVAVINNIDVIITWNCRHMANIDRKRAINEINQKMGFGPIDIITPLEVVEID
jgi:predicted nucleic acid-binding protein